MKIGEAKRVPRIHGEVLQEIESIIARDRLRIAVESLSKISRIEQRLSGDFQSRPLLRMHYRTTPSTEISAGIERWKVARN